MSDGILNRLKAALLDSDQQGREPIVLPDELLYDDIGLDIWAKIIFTPEFYQTRDEIQLFERNSDEIAKHIPIGSVMVDLGAGDLRKVGRLLSVLEKRGDKTNYLALDISHKSLRTNLDQLAPKHDNVSCSGLWGDFLGGLDWVENLDPALPRVFLSLGSVLFNNATATAVSDLKRWAALMRPQDLILAGMDGHSIRDHRDKVWAAYHAHDDLYAEFWANGFAHANTLLGEELLDPADWENCAEIDEKESRHRFFFRAKGDVKLGSADKVITAGRELEWFDAHKQDEQAVRAMCTKAGLEVLNVWKMPDSEMTQYLLKRKSVRENSPSDVDSAISMV